MTPTQVQFHANREQRRHNKASEKLSSEQNKIAWKNLAELVRHQQATESETNRSNLARESIDLMNANESARTHRANEALQGESILKQYLAALYSADKSAAAHILASQIAANTNYAIKQLDYQLQTELQKIRNSGIWDSTVVGKIEALLDNLLGVASNQTGVSKQDIARLGFDSVLGVLAPDFSKLWSDYTEVINNGKDTEVTKAIKRWFNSKTENGWK